MKKIKMDIEFLRKIPLFSSLPEKELDKINGRLLITRFKKNETIFREDDINEFMYIIMSGKVKVVRTTEEGKEIILAIHNQDEFFGEISLIDGRTSPAKVLATVDSVIAIVPRKDFYFLLFNNNKILENLLRILCERLRESWEKIHIMNFRNSAQRLKMLLLLLSHDNGEKTAGGIEIGLKLTHQDIAEMSGLTRETVTRSLDKWQKDGDITILKNKLIRLNPTFLKKDFDV